MNKPITLSDAVRERLELVTTDTSHHGYSPARMVVRDIKTRKMYVLSEAFVPYTGQEILVFNARNDGDVVDWLEVAGGRGITWDEAILSLLEYVNR
jgi:hypothetical protein